ncbi:MAG TPA: hypothetical protein VL100_02740 [Croceibacterium sp.]|nr:hypothetical protein [Croceibacterium sp.]
MIARNSLIVPVRRTAWFFGAMLVVLASALAAALIPSGPPASRLTGSAFDPSTTAVALRVRTQKAADKAILSQLRFDEDAPRGGGAAPAPAGLMSPALAALPLPIPSLLLVARPYDLPPESGFHLSTRAARAPPACLA